MKRLRKHIIPWTLAVLMALTCGASAAFANEDVQPVEGEAVGDTVSVEAEQSGVSQGDENTDAGQEEENTDVSQEDENTDVSLEDENSGDGELQTEETDNARLGDGSEETGSEVYYYPDVERTTDTNKVFPGETASFTTRMYRYEYESSPGKDYTSTRIYDYTVDWSIVQINDEIEGGEEIEEYTIISSEGGKSIDIKVNKSSPVSHFEIHPTFHMGDKTIDLGETDFLYVKNEIFSGKITNNYGYIEPSLPGDSADYNFEVSWKKFDAETGKVIDMDTSELKTDWEVVLCDNNFVVDATNDILDYVSYKVDADNPNLLHFKINEGWVDEDKNVLITATAYVEDKEISASDYRWVNLRNEVIKFETDECWAEAGSVISINELNPKAKLHNKENPKGIEAKGYKFRFLDLYQERITDGSVPLKDVTVSPDGKTLTVPKVEDGRYIVCINVDSEKLGTQFYAPIHVVNKDAAEITDNKAAGSDKDSKSDKDSVQTGDDAELALWLALMILAGAGITGTALYTRRKRTNE